MHGQQNIKKWHYWSAFLFNPSLFSWGSDVSCLYEIWIASGDLKVIKKKLQLLPSQDALNYTLTFSYVIFARKVTKVENFHFPFYQPSVQ